jgi:hypothetical protein
LKALVVCLISAIVLMVSIIAGASISTDSGDTITVHAARRGNPWINFQDGRALKSKYIAAAGLEAAGLEQPLGQGQAQAVALASGDVNVDGFPDLVVGYANQDGGLLALHRGDPEAFGPQKRETIEGIKRGRFPDPFLPEATLLWVPEAPDFLAVGDFNNDTRIDILTAMRGSTTMYLVARDEQGGFHPPEPLPLPGQVTAVVTGQISSAHTPWDVAVGVVGDDGAQVLIYATRQGVLTDEPLRVPLPAEATALAIGQLDEKLPVDLAVAAGNQVIIIHGPEQALPDYAQHDPLFSTQTPPVETMGFPLAIASLAVGDFIPDRDYRIELALLSEDGTVHLIARGELDTRPLTPEEGLERRRQWAEARGRGQRPDLTPWQPGQSAPWSEVQSVAVGASLQYRERRRPVANAPGTAQALLLSSNTGTSPGEELLVLDAVSQRLHIILADPDSLSETVATRPQLMPVALDVEGTPVAMLPMRLNVMALPSLVAIREGQIEPTVIMAAPLATFSVDRNDDTAAATACTAAANDCSLRGAIIASNTAAGADMITFSSNLPVLTITGSDNTAMMGDLDINPGAGGSLTIMGNAGTTIIDTNYASGCGDCKVFGVNQDGTHSGITVSFSGVTIQDGFNDHNATGSFQETGGGIDFFLTGLSNMYSMTNCVVTSNEATTEIQSYGGGINIDSGAPNGGSNHGTVTFTNCTISNNTADATGGGINNFEDVHNLTITNCMITGNTTLGPGSLGAQGGGIKLRSTNGGTVMIQNSTMITSNTAKGFGGGLDLVTGNVALTFSMCDTTISSNTSQSQGTTSSVGGGLSLAGPATLTNLTISNNHSDQAAGGGSSLGGGLFHGGGTVTFDGGTISNNTSDGSMGSGGGVAMNGGTLTITNVTLTGNSATTSGGAFYVNGTGSPGAMLNASLCRIVSNTAASGSGIAQTMTGVATVENNWWGCDGFPNATGCQTGSGTFDADPRIDLVVTATPSTVGFSDMSTVKADVSKNTNGVTINPSVMNGLPVTFSPGANGMISPTMGTISSLMETSTYTAPATCPVPNNTMASATVDNGTQTVTITIEEPPTIMCPANIMTNTDPGMCTAVETFMPVVDGCPAPTVVCMPASGFAFPKGVTTVTCTATNGVGSPAMCSFTVTVVDNEPPTIMCPANITTNTAMGMCSATVTFMPTVNDNCPGVMFTCMPASGSVFPKGTTTVTCQATDAVGLMSPMCSFTVTVNDNEAPMVGPCPSNITTTTDPGVCTAVVMFTPPPVTDNCPGVGPVMCVPASGTAFPKGVTTVTCSATDAMGNTGNCMFTVTVNDNQPPMLGPCPANITTNTDPGMCTAVVMFPPPMATDNCPMLGPVMCTPASGSMFPKGTTTVTCSVADMAGNMSSCTFTVTVNDNEPPMIVCPGNVTVNTGPGICTAVGMYGGPMVSDNCPGAGMPTCSPASGSTFAKGVTTVTCTVSDASGNMSSCTFTVTVNDNEAPMLGACPGNITQNTDLNLCTAVVTYTAPTATDNCPMLGAVTCSPASGSAFPKGTTTVTCSVTDMAGNTSSCMFTVTVNDNQNPTITCPANITTNTDPDLCTAVVTFTATATDNCPMLGAVTCSSASGSMFPKGTTTVTCSVTDMAGNTSLCSFTVTVNDNQPPTLSPCPANITTNNDPGMCSAVVTYMAPTATDNCPGVGMVTCSPASGTAFPVGTTTVTCSVSDAMGNMASCTFTVTVVDNVNPTITCPANITTNTDPGQCTAVVTFTPTAMDNCLGVTTSCTPASGSAFAKGTTTVTCTATDASGNTSTCMFTVTVNDNEAPTAVCPGNITTTTDSGVCTAVVMFTATASDNCPGATISCSPASGSAFNKGVTTVTCAATDASGNTATCSFTVTVNDTQPPSITCPANITQNTPAGQCSAMVTYASPMVSDNCPGMGSPTCSPASGSTFPVGTTTVTCTVSDAMGNTASCTFTVTVVDNQPPAITCSANITVTNTLNLLGATVSFTVTATDNCPGVTTTCVPASGSFFPIGISTVSCTATDVGGLSASCQFTVTVTAPVALTQMTSVDFQPQSKRQPPANRGLLVTDFANDQLQVLMGNGDGTFQRGPRFAVGDGPTALAVGDVNADGRTDVIVANLLSNDLSLLLGNGNGTFQRQRLIPAGAQPSAVAVGDFTGDRRLDIVVANFGDDNVLVLIGQADGSFRPGQRVAVGDGPTGIAVADFTSDGRLDVAVSTFGSNNVTVLHGQGDGGFTRAGSVFVGDGPMDVVAADFTGDGQLELATVNFTSNDVTILKAGGRAGFEVDKRRSVGQGPVALVAAALVTRQTGIAAANLASGEVTVRPGDPGGELNELQRYSVVTAPVALTVGDFNNDGRLDLAVLDADGQTVRVLLDTGDGRFRPASR